MARTPMRGFVTASCGFFSDNIAVFPWTSSSVVASGNFLPAASLKELALFETRHGQTFHRTGDLLACFGERLGIVEMRGADDYGVGAGLGFCALFGIVQPAVRIALDIQRRGALLHEDSGADEDGLRAKLHHESRIRRRPRANR